ncbi:MAG: 2-hydroxy-3-oxopropionate reductase [Actinomycetota bacterium]|jgi:3-hydroxyisobutyrate dehydrogenase-like beta-hydroxyacid dehydrogenase|nr:2-hydroxy-3-oxopropionate reductase [Actinomycetota bacterium]
MDAARIGFIGLGAMGARMAARLLDVGFDLTVHNRTRARETDLIGRGATSASSPAELATRTDVVVGCLLDDGAIEQVYRGDDGLVSAARRGQVFIEHATFSPALAGDIERELAKRDAVFLDAPVSGGPEGAAAGTLAVMVGGNQQSLAAVVEVVQAYASRVVHIGPTGAGLELKLVNQLLVSCHAAAAAEAAELMRRMGMPLGVASAVLNASWANSAMLSRMFDRRLAEENTPSEATVEGLATPQRLVRELLAEHDLAPAVSNAALDAFATARARGRGRQDLTELLEAAQC